ncbi:Protein of unknown function DUF1677, plant [Dillenia turbinata]|uniref:Uncharacterized protein n=1 Tax=Dillenia turbinata TaxID=194707 RepID=A0AAN8WAJ2_9MAGN
MAVGETESSIKVEAETVKCASCGFTEECTPAYIARIKERYQGKWICGLCIEAVKDEVLRSEKLISTEEALNRHISFCSEFRSFIPPKISVSEHPIFVMGRVLRRSLDSPRPLRTSSMRKLDEVSHGRPLVRSESCFPSLSS